MSYNGWTNWETWVIGLHFGDMFNDLSLEYTRDEWDSEILKSMVEEVLESEDVPTVGIVADFVNGCMSAVNWRELANHYQPEEESVDEDA